MIDLRLPSGRRARYGLILGILLAGVIACGQDADSTSTDTPDQSPAEAPSSTASTRPQAETSGSEEASQVDGSEPPVPAPPPPAPLPPAKPPALEVTTQQIDSCLLIEVRAGEPLTPLRDFGSSDPPRYLVDIPGAWSLSRAEYPTPSSPFVDRVRLTAQPDHVELAIDLQLMLPSPKIESTENGLRVSVCPTS